MLNLTDYQETNQIYTGTNTLVYRAIRTSDRQPAIVKVLRNPHPSVNELLQFRNQYLIARELEHPLLVQPIALEDYGNGYALVMKDEGEISLGEYWQKSPRSLGEFLAIATQLSKVLHYLNQKRIVHKDIKPSNILINPKTRLVKLIDFSISSLLPKEQQQLTNPNLLEGTLAYISPEQTGRMNRGIDYRTDFYSLGVTFFELLTGSLPFTSTDPMELVHCHLARAVKFPASNEQSAVPKVVQAIVLKLVEKNAEHRYQSALGLKHDLERCLQQWQATGEINPFQLGERDLCDRFLIPEKLYGREREVQTLLDAFERVANGTTEMMLVAGFSGIGKTAVVNEVHKPIVRQRGYFIKGKFDQFNRNIPFSAFVQAFRDLMGQLLGESDAKLAIWRRKILAAVGENGQRLIEVIPELELIIGKQPAVPELCGSATQNCFKLLFGKFVRVFTIKEHPLVIFLDDLQWADSASLNLLKLLLEESEAGYLLVLGAYRDNEVFPAHPLMLTLQEIQQQGAKLNTLTLKSLSEVEINRLVADTLLCSLKVATPLSELVYQKTQGNPFFTTQFLQGLYEEKFVRFDYKVRYWLWDLLKVRQFALANNVVSFMVGRLCKLPEATQKVLKLAACIGNQFDLKTLAIMCEQAQEEVAKDLWPGLSEGFVVPETETYKFFQGELNSESNTESITVSYRFLHDRVQQAAYSLIPEEQKQVTHYYIGQVLLQKTSLEAREEKIFELVNQLNYGTSLITEQKERDELAKLNLIACRKARATTAYQAGRDYASTGLSLLGKNAWQRQYDMNLEFHNLGAELASLCGDFEAMEQFAEIVIKQARSLLDQTNVYRIRIQSNIYQNQPTQALNIGKKFLQQLGVTFPETPTENDIQQAVAEIEELIGDREIEDLTDLPELTDREKIAIVDIACSIASPACISGSNLLPLLVSLSVKLSIQYGTTLSSLYPYVLYGNMACNMMLDVDAGVKFGQLVLQFVSKLEAKAVKPDVLQAIACFTLHRKFHIKETLPLVKEGYNAGLEVGSLEFVGYGAQLFCLHSFWSGQPLTTLEQEIRAYTNTLVQLNQSITANWCRIYWQSTLNLQGLGEDPSVLSGEAFQEAEFLELLGSARDLFGLYLFYLYKLMLGYLFGEIESAQIHTIESRNYLRVSTGTIVEPVFYFYDSLTALATVSLQSAQQSEVLQRVEQNQARLQKQWAHYAPHESST